MDFFSRPITALSGVGKVRAEALLRLGIETVGDLIAFYPRAYENRGEISLIKTAPTDAPTSLILTVGTAPRSAKIKRGMTLTKFRAFDESGTVEITFFNSPYIKDVFSVGQEFRFYGKIERKARSFAMTNPKYEPICEGKALQDLIPVYHLTEGITSKYIEKLLRDVIDDAVRLTDDFLPEAIRLENNLPHLALAIRNIHFPDSHEALSSALRRMAFDELLTFGLGISLNIRHKNDREGVRFSPCSLSPFTDMLKFELTGSQKLAINDIYNDTVLKCKGDKLPPMTRIVVGDVGCGKTVVCMAAIYIAAKSSYQSALMVPTEILARQHFKELCEVLSPLGIKCELLVGATSQKEKNRIYSEAASGECQVIVGTHALISDKLSFKKLGLVVTDEQHRFGVGQRAALKEKSAEAHLLVMSATPIPRTLALAMYGDLDVSRITEMPKGRMRVDTFLVDSTYRERLNSFIEKQVKLSGQVYVVCPSIEPTEDGAKAHEPSSFSSLFKSNDTPLKNATEYAKELAEALPALRVGCLHGRMKSKEKDEVMRRFSSGELDVLVSTTVIEVGVNVPSATLMVIENAERFGLSQLHQLRGRVGRGKMKSYCILVSDTAHEISRARLDAMRTTYDGYEIAEKDLLLRGPGDFFSQISADSFRQSGGFEFRFAKLCDDSTLMERAFSVAKDIVARDKDLTLDEHQLIRKMLEGRITVAPSSIS
ncbi:MAG: ATP-dependent DNA helicase RecG [Clostridia bacterium]|nr:ATP-dependent DNA helicase RecG [Clostridia bacterium]